jgi:hypothetical protein
MRTAASTAAGSSGSNVRALAVGSALALALSGAGPALVVDTPRAPLQQAHKAASVITLDQHRLIRLFDGVPCTDKQALEGIVSEPSRTDYQRATITYFGMGDVVEACWKVHAVDKVFVIGANGLLLDIPASLFINERRA